ncbi:HAD family hydrolase [Oceanospirillum sanctuarii]|uniref:HAD family hydrolase n=1 Tax=Oceanospirillum sanctuarii TaxID=1434821 RepID=UPI001C3CCC54|nr:HAD family hydrolase [Oceanospirillum sanctuarii]
MSDSKTKQPIFLFDWGDTLMVDFPEMTGKMKEWPKVQMQPKADEVLAELSKSARLFVATGAADSAESDIRAAFDRVGLCAYLEGYFCQSNLGIGKGTPRFYQAIIKQLGVTPDQCTMVGDHFEKDIAPALEAGLKAIWLTDQRGPAEHRRRQFLKIKSLNELLH